MNKIGLLWFDDRRITLQQKLNSAVQHYHARFLKMPNVCFVHPEQLTGQKPVVCGLKLEGSATISRNQFWLRRDPGAAQGPQG